MVALLALAWISCELLSVAADDSSSMDTKTARRAKYERWRRQHCTNCTVNGKEYQGHSRFRYDEGCFRYRCTCRCDGSWQCPAERTINLCERREQAKTRWRNQAEKRRGEGRRRHRECKTCRVNGTDYPGHAYFRHTDGCTSYDRCICHCNGTWLCPASWARNVCGNQTTAAAPRTSTNAAPTTTTIVTATTTMAAATTTTTAAAPATQYGVTTTAPTEPGVRTNSSSSSGGGRSRRQYGRCLACTAFGKTYKGNSVFQAQLGCTNYTRCLCECNGSWNCPARFAVNTCTASPSSTTRKGCNSCSAKGKTFPGGHNFSHTDGCVEYRDCVCNCDGSWSCPGSAARNVCADGDERSTTVSSTAQGKACSECSVYGETFEGGKHFTISRDCWEFRDCMCHCNGSWICPPQSSRNLCKTGKDDAPSRCKACEAYGKFFTDQRFNVTDGCLEYRYCTCRCDGYWECKGENAINICEVKPPTTTSAVSQSSCYDCTVKGKTVAGGTEFELTDGCYHYTGCSCACDGSWDCPAETGRDLCSETQSGSGCRKCKSTDGRIHLPNRPFQFIDDCIERNCDCFCNGSWSCPGDRSKWICTDRCRGCEVEGRQVGNNTQFQHRTGCLEYTCSCHCNGSWSCPGETVRNTCPVGVRDNCNKCQISASEQYPGESDFVLRQGCLHYKCRCNCDGSYNCPGEDSRNICHGEELGGCRSCVVSPNEIYQGGSDFNLRRECITSECTCFCNGTWQCPVEKYRNVCIGEDPGGCTTCQVDSNLTFRGNTDFDYRKDCFHYQCRCNCDGSWNCPGEHTRNLCKGEVPGGCRSCEISEQEFYPGDSNFEMVKNCIHYKCRCSCDGSYSCPGHRARRVCVLGPNGEERPIDPRDRRPRCLQCQVPDGNKFEGNTNFTLTEGCFQYQCSCKCDGSYECPAERTKNTCNDSPRRSYATSEPRGQPQCRPCSAYGTMYLANSSFSLTRDCYRHNCDCHCNGSFTCPAERTVNICRDSRSQETTTRPARCYTCRAFGEEHAGNSSFSFTRGCFKYNCDCHCDGRYECPAARTIDVCRKPDSTSSTPRPRESPCRRCRVSDQSQFEGNTEFSLQQGCYKFFCSCACDGSWNCPASKTVDTCSESYRRNTTSSVTSPGHSCSVCRRDGREYSAGTAYKITNGCQQFDCTCQCDGSSSCDLNNPTNICLTRQHRGDEDTGRSRPKFQSPQDANKKSCLSCNVIGQQVSPGQEFHLERNCVRYTNCQCRCNGHWQCANRENVCVQERVSDNERVVVKKFEGASSIVRTPAVSQETFDGQNQGRRGQEMESSAWVYVDGDDSSFVKVKDNDRTGGGYKIEVQTKYAPSFDTRNSRPVAEIRDRKTSKVYTASGSRPGNESFIQHEVDASESPVATGRGISRCNKCAVDTREYPSGAHFDKRRGCVVYKCLCLCSGSYRCRVTADHHCTEEKRTSSCSNCQYNGMIFPGDMGFTVREGCLERHCSCHCNGTHSCPSSKPLPGCSAAAQVSGGQAGAGSFYPNQPHVPTSVGYVRRSGHPVYTHCPSCGSGGSVVYHNPTQTAQHPENPTLRAKPEPESNRCGGCEVEGTFRAGGETFTFQKDCVEFDCYCSCGGSWKCSGRPLDCKSSTEESPRSPGQAGGVREEIDHTRDVEVRDDSRRHFRPAPAVAPPELLRSGRCVDCVVDGRTVKHDTSFVRRQGCLETVCRCDCQGQHVCPQDDAVNVCQLESRKSVQQKKGCQVGNKVYLTREFHLVESCVQRTCVCHDDGTYTCARTPQDLEVC